MILLDDGHLGTVRPGAVNDPTFKGIKMKKILVHLFLSVVTLGFSVAASAADDAAKATYKTAKDNATATYKEARTKCNELKDNAKDV